MYTHNIQGDPPVIVDTVKNNLNFHSRMYIGILRTQPRLKNLDLKLERLLCLKPLLRGNFFKKDNKACQMCLLYRVFHNTYAYKLVLHTEVPHTGAERCRSQGQRGAAHRQRGAAHRQRGAAHRGREVPLTGSEVPHTGREVPLTGREVPHTGREVPHTGAERCRTQVERCRSQEERCRTQAERCRTQAERCRTQAERCRTQAERYRSQAERCRTQAERCRTQAERCRTIAAVKNLRHLPVKPQADQILLLDRIGLSGRCTVPHSLSTCDKGTLQPKKKYHQKAVNDKYTYVLAV